MNAAAKQKMWDSPHSAQRPPPPLPNWRPVDFAHSFCRFVVFL